MRDWNNIVEYALLPTYHEFINAVNLTFGNTTIKHRLLLRKALRYSNPNNTSSYESLLPLVYLFKRHPIKFYNLIKKWSRHSRVLSQQNTLSGLYVDEPTLMDFLQRSSLTNDPIRFNYDIARLWGCSQAVSEAMTTQRTTITSLPILPLMTSHLQLPRQDYVNAVEVFDAYTSRITIHSQDNQLMKYLHHDAYSDIHSLFVSQELDTTHLLGWQIVRCIIPQLSIDTVIQLSHKNVAPIDVLHLSAIGFTLSIIQQILINGLDIELATSLHYADIDAPYLDHHAVLFIDEVLLHRRSKYHNALKGINSSMRNLYQKAQFVSPQSIKVL